MQQTYWDEEIKKKLGGCGKGCKISNLAIFYQPEKVFLGDYVRIDPQVIITGELRTGNFVQICANSFLNCTKHPIVMGDWTYIGFGSQVFTCSEKYNGEGGPVNLFWNPNNHTVEGPVIFNKFSGIASQCFVMPNINLPEGCVIGCQSMVYNNFCKNNNAYFNKESLTPYTICVGNPLKFFGYRNKEQIIKVSNEIEQQNAK